MHKDDLWPQQGVGGSMKGQTVIWKWQKHGIDNRMVGLWVDLSLDGTKSISTM